MPRLGHDSRFRFVALGSGDADLRAHASGRHHQRIANIVAVADISELEPAQFAETFFQREKIGVPLARMEAIGQRIDHRNTGVFGQLIEFALFEHARHDSLHPAR